MLSTGDSLSPVLTTKNFVGGVVASASPYKLPIYCHFPIKNATLGSMKRLALLLMLLWLAGCDTPASTPAPTLRVTVVIQQEPTMTPSVIPSLTPDPAIICEGAPPVQLIVNQRGRVLSEDTDPLNIRQSPGTSDA